MNSFSNKHTSSAQKILPASAGRGAAPVTDNRPQTAIQRKQLKAMNSTPPVQKKSLSNEYTTPGPAVSGINNNAPVQLAKWKYQTGKWVKFSGGNNNSPKAFPLNAAEGDIFDDETGVHATAPSSSRSVMIKPVSTGPVSSGGTKPVSSSSQPLHSSSAVSNTPVHREVHLQQTQKMRGGPTEYYNSDHNVDSKFAISVNTSAKTCEVIIRIQSSADKAIFGNWAQATSDKWSKRFGLRVLSSRASRSGFYMIDVNLVQVGGTDHPHHVVVPQNSDETFAGVRGMKGTRSMTEWGTKDAVDVPHEVGHMLGNLDEYYTINDHEYTAPGENARSGVDVGEGSIMNDPKNNPLAKHYELIRKEAATAIGTNDKNVTIEEAGHMAQSSKPSRVVTKPVTGGGISLGDISGAKGGLKKTSPTPLKPGPVTEEPITDFRGVLRSTTVKKTSVEPPEKSSSAEEQPITGFRSTLRKTPAKKPVSQVPEMLTAPVEPKKLSSSSKPVPEKRTVPTLVPEIEEPVTKPIEKTASKVRRPLPEPPQNIPVAPVEQQPVEEPQETITAEAIATRRRDLVFTAFETLKQLLTSKQDSIERDNLIQARSRLRTMIGEGWKELGDDIFLNDEHWQKIRNRVGALKERIDQLEDE